MKKKHIALKNIAIVTILISLFIACDKDFASLDSDIINNDTATHFKTDAIHFNVVTYNKKLGPVQTNNLPINLLGIYNDPLYGLTSYNIVSQINTDIFDREFGENVVMDSVVLTIPYYSKTVNVTDEGETIYELDSVFGNSPIKLSIYENNYFLRDFDPSSENLSQQKYFSDGSTGLDQISSTQLEGQLLAEVTDFIPSEKEIKLTDSSGVVTERLVPSIRLKLDNDFWFQKIIEKEGGAELSNSNNFKNYFRGIYFKTETHDMDGNMALLNLADSNANITMYYTLDDPVVEGGGRVGRSYIFTFTGNRVNFISPLNYPIPEGNTIDGDEKLFLKGGQGSIAIIDILNGLIEDPETGLDISQLDYFKSKKGKWLINEANIIFYVDQESVNGLNEPERIYIYDLENRTPLIDYYADVDNTINPLNSKIAHLGRLERIDDSPNGIGIKYKFRITEHLNNILLRDSTNVKLGLAVSANVNLEGANPQRNVLDSDNLIKKIPSSSILTPQGTVLFGNNTSVEQKKVSLEIFYTEPNNN